MSKQANKTLIGVFVVIAAALAVAAVLILGSGTLFEQKHKWVAFFEGSVKGLRVGAPVSFRGVPIGQATATCDPTGEVVFEARAPGEGVVPV